MSEKILVTGATGKVGREVVRALVEQGFEVKAGTRNPRRARDLFDGSVEIVELDYERVVTYDGAVQWADRVLLTPPPFDPDAYETLRPFLDWTVSSGTRHVVLLSAMGAERVEELALRKLERHLEQVGVEHTILRPNLFMQNFAPGFLSEEIRERNTVSLPAGDARVSFVDVRDVAAVANRALGGDEHFGQAYTLTGPQALTIAEAADVLSEVTGRSIRYRAIEEQEMGQFLEARGWEAERVETALGLFGSIRDGWRAPVTESIPAILGEPATAFEEYARQHRAHWEPSG